MGRKKKQRLALVDGAAFAMPLTDGHFGVCRVLRNATDDESREWGAGSVLVASSAWMGDAVPDASDPTLRPILRLTHHAWKQVEEILWISDPLPDDFLPLGGIEPTADERDRPCYTMGGWASPRLQIRAQWRWDNEREVVLAEDAAEHEAALQKRCQLEEEQKVHLTNVTLEQLQEHVFFPNWTTYPSKKAILKSRQIMEETVQALLVLGNEATEQARLAVLQVCIERFNTLDEELDNFIETGAREDICEEFEALVHACGLGTHQDLADEWRDW